jgi:hypothetical protein
VSRVQGFSRVWFLGLRVQDLAQCCSLLNAYKGRGFRFSGLGFRVQHDAVPC